VVSLSGCSGTVQSNDGHVADAAVVAWSDAGGPLGQDGGAVQDGAVAREAGPRTDAAWDAGSPDAWVPPADAGRRDGAPGDAGPARQWAPRFDHDGDGRADLALYHREEGRYEIRLANGQVQSQQLGRLWGEGWYAAEPAPADYDGDGRTDLAVFLPEGGLWTIKHSGDGQTVEREYGYGGTQAVPADYDGDGRADLAVHDPRNATWFIMGSTAGHRTFVLGQAGDVPVPADYDGDGRADPACYRPSDGRFQVDGSRGQLLDWPTGVANARALAADFRGAGHADAVLWQRDGGRWMRWDRTQQATVFQADFGWWAVEPAPDDWDGDGLTDLVVYHPEGSLYSVMATRDGFSTFVLGGVGARPVMGGPPPAHETCSFTGENFLWKPESEGSGNLVVLLPTRYADNLPAQVVVARDPAGHFVMPGGVGDPSGVFSDGRPAYRFPHPGSHYGGPCFLVLQFQQGNPKPYRIRDGATRQN
jgi:hypothetical protein